MSPTQPDRDEAGGFQRIPWAVRRHIPLALGILASAAVVLQLVRPALDEVERLDQRRVQCERTARANRGAAAEIDRLNLERKRCVAALAAPRHELTIQGDPILDRTTEVIERVGTYDEIVQLLTAIDRASGIVVHECVIDRTSTNGVLKAQVEFERTDRIAFEFGRKVEP
jgi:hypothetical protein